MVDFASRPQMLLAKSCLWPSVLIHICAWPNTKVLYRKLIEEDPWEDHDWDGKPISGGTPRCCWLWEEGGDFEDAGISVGELLNKRGPGAGFSVTEKEEEKKKKKRRKKRRKRKKRKKYKGKKRKKNIMMMTEFC